ncbi:uncharacterized protein LOC126604501 [Malus sylvestris]|uniref:uncharacterized protein LOC126604501 n=1 Tax=Malus sylvestris TaxID=3752 RepID=UPI0021ACD2E4|nr:uncharacterized protein LOC126604501 [Malus sylvestris]
MMQNPEFLCSWLLLRLCRWVLGKVCEGPMGKGDCIQIGRNTRSASLVFVCRTMIGESPHEVAILLHTECRMTNLESQLIENTCRGRHRIETPLHSEDGDELESNEVGKSTSQ